MSEFPRLLDASPNPLTRELLRSGLGERPSSIAARRAAVSLGLSAGFAAKAAGAAGIGGAAVVGGGVAGPTGAAIGATVLVKWFALGAMAGALVATGSSLVVRANEGGASHARANVGEVAGPNETAPPADETAPPADETAPPADETAPPADETAPPVANDANASPGAAPLPPGALADAKASVARGTARHGAVGAEPQRPPQNPPASAAASPGMPAVAGFSGPNGALSRELEPIDRARAALARGAAPAVLAELSRYAAVRETGTFDREALLLRIEALTLLGERAQAAELARGYLARYPKDAHSARLRELGGSN